MDLSSLILLLLGSSVHFGHANFFHRHKTYPLSNGEDLGEPLLLSPFIKSNRLAEGRDAAKVCEAISSLAMSYSGLFTVDEGHSSNMFFWYFPAENDNGSAPVVVWLNGGPGASSTIGLFTENGPFYVDKGGALRKRKVGSWSEDFHMIYFDNPVGTGFSYTGDDGGYAEDEVAVGKGLRSAVTQFLQLFPNLANRELYLTGESYAGKYVPAMADALRGSGLNLKGIAMGNGYTAPELMLDYGEYLNQIGLLDADGKAAFKARQDEIKDAIDAKDWPLAFKLLWSFVVGGGMFQNLTGFTNHYNYLHDKDITPYGDTDEFLQRSEVRKCIHVGNLTFNTGERVQQHLEEDFPKSMKGVVEQLLEEMRVMIYSGQLDIIVAYPLTENFISKLEWSGAQDYKTTQRKPWKVDGKLAGYTKSVGKLTEVLVRDAGHMVPMDQPIWALDMIKRFIENRPF